MRPVISILGCLAMIVAIAGCTRGSGQRAQWTPVRSDEAAVTAPSTGSPKPADSSQEVVEPRASTPVLPPPGVPGWSPGKWLKLSDWAKSELGTSPRKVANGSGVGFAVETAMGKVILTPTTRLASFEGMTFWLGFAPVLAEDDCLVHELDLKKNILPLLGESSAELRRPGKVVIDAGHGGENHGTRSVLPGLLEKDMTLDWALRLEPLLRDQGWEVMLTRRDDRDVSLADRVQMAEDWGADLFLSLHFNSAFPQTEQSGLETFCMTPVGMPSTLTRNYEDDTSRVFLNNAHDEDNLRYAVRLHRALLQAGEMPDRSVRRARFMGVLRGQQRPAVLIEAGYLSNPDEARRVATPEYRQLLAEAVARGLATSTWVARDSSVERPQTQKTP